MKTAVLQRNNEITIEDLDLPVVGPGEVLIKVKYAGVCGSDIHAYKGMHPFRKPPVVLGHEVSGVIEKCPDGINGLNVGDSVTVMPALSCGKCPMCREGKTNICLNKKVPGIVGWQGTFAEYFVAPASITYKLPVGLSLKAGVLAEPLATGVHSAKTAGVKKGHDVLILGGGTIGILTAIAAKALGAKSVAITDVLDFNLKMAEELCGADPFNVREGNLIERLLEKYPEKFNSVVLCASAEDTVHQSILLVRRGGRVVVTGMYLKPIAFNFIDLTLNEIEMVGSQIYTDDDFCQALRMLQDDENNFLKIVTHSMSLAKADQALRILVEHSEDAVKILLDAQL